MRAAIRRATVDDQGSFAKIPTAEPSIYLIFQCLLSDECYWVEVRAAWGTQMGDGYNQHKLPAFVVFVLSALAVCSWEHQAESVQPSSCSQELLRKTARHFAPWSVLLSSTPVVCPSLPVQEIRFWDHQAEGEDCTSHTGKSFSMTFIGLQFTSMSSNPNYQKLLTAK